ncbi:MAG: TIGR04282 family arsenosugar biosynthesis glycosyltransferase, partial [Pseudomonas sp.]
CTGDQAIFVRRDLFQQLGGYADIPLMEDIELSRRLRRISRPACLRPTLSTSSRKWQKHGVVRTILLMWWIRLQYWAGVSPERLVHQYYHPPGVSRSISTQSASRTTPGRDGTRPLPGNTQTTPPGVSSSTSTQSAQKPTRPLLIFAKAPSPGSVKTRLIPALGAQGACDLYQQLLLHTLEQTRDWPGPRYLYCAPDTQHPLFQHLATEHVLTLRQQHSGDLGHRMVTALAEHQDGALLIGSDCPALNTEALLEANQALDTYDNAIIPSEDGGYVMVGQRQPNPAPFTDMNWSHAKVLADTQQRLQAAQQSLWLGPVLWDLDEPQDLPRLQDFTLPAVPNLP